MRSKRLGVSNKQKKETMKNLNQITEIQTVKVTPSNYWLINLMYGDAAEDSTAKFQIPANIKFKQSKNG